MQLIPENNALLTKFISTMSGKGILMSFILPSFFRSYLILFWVKELSLEKCRSSFYSDDSESGFKNELCKDSYPHELIRVRCSTSRQVL